MERIKGQALVELAIFGSILLMLLGVILSYGLRYGLQQKTMMHAFRKTLSATANEAQGGQASYLYIQDRHIPNPANPWAVGSVAPFQASANVIRSYKLHENPEFGKPEELPQIVIEIKGDHSYTTSLKTAGFRKETISCESREKYEEIYGGVNIDGLDKCEGSEDSEEDSYAAITIIDPCEGELINYDGCKRQCRMITNLTFCERECERGKEKGSTKNCQKICSQDMNIPWYCSALDDVFSFAIAKSKPKVMGIQPDYTETVSINNQLTRTQTGDIISTYDTINWTATTTRDIVYLDHLDTSTGEARVASSADIRRRQIPNTVSESTTWNCTDGVCR